MLPSDVRAYRESIRAKCVGLGVDEVRRMLAEGRFAGRKKAWASEWLGEHDAVANAIVEAREKDVDRGIARTSNSITLWLGIIGNVIAVAALGTAIYAAVKP